MGAEMRAGDRRAAVQFGILGLVKARGPEGELRLGSPRHRMLLTTLLVEPGRVVPMERLIEALWGDAPPGRAVEMVHVRISELRRLLRTNSEDLADLIITRRPGYLLDVSPRQVDSHQFEELAVAGRRALAAGDTKTASDKLVAALSLWRGPPLADLTGRAFARPEISRLEHLRAQAVQDRIGADMASGRQRDVLAELQGLVQAHPLAEPYRAQLMLALYREGRQADALDAYQQAVVHLRDELGIDPNAELQRLHISILRRDSSLDGPPSTGEEPETYDIPVQLTSFVGREEAVNAACEHLTHSRLVTLTGVGGVGKSRLAVEVALASRNLFRSGTWIVEMAPVFESGLVDATIAQTLGVRERPDQAIREAIVERLGSAKALLVIDNCEHLLLEVVDLVQHLLRSCSELRILCASRERLGLTGEVVYPIAGLSVPAEDSHLADTVQNASAVQLFVDRASAVQAGFRLTDDNASDVSEITRRLDGLPLCIELAAARLGAFGVRQIAERLEDPFRLLSRGSRDALPHHQTLRAVVDWSYGLLTHSEQRLFENLSVFVGGFSFEPVEEVCAGADLEQPEDLLSRLIDKSLVVADAVDSPEYRYRMLETLRIYGLEALTRRLEAEPAREAHARYYLGLATRAAAGLRSAGLAHWLDRLRAEHANMREAMDWCLRSENDEWAALIASSLYPFWDLHGHYREGREWLRRVVAEGKEVSAEVRARVLMGTATLAVIQGDLAAADEACRLAAEFSRASSDGAGLSHALQYLGLIAICADDLCEAEPLIVEAIRIAADAHAGWEAAWAHMFSCTLSLARGQFEEAAHDADRSELLNGPDGDRELLAWVHLTRGVVQWGSGHPHAGAPHLTHAIQAFDTLDGLWGLSLSLLVAGMTLADGGQERDGLSVLAASEAVRESAGIGMLPFAGVWRDQMVIRLRQQLSPEDYEREWRDGRRLPTADAVQRSLLHLEELRVSSRQTP